MKEKRVFLSQPMFGYTDDELVENRLCAKKKLLSVYPDVTVVDSCVTVDEQRAMSPRPKHIDLYFLGRSLQLLATCDAIFMMDGWHWSRSCVVQKLAATNYDLTILYESPEKEEMDG